MGRQMGLNRDGSVWGRIYRRRKFTGREQDLSTKDRCRLEQLRMSE